MVSRGITLLEMLAVVLLVGIIAALALPGYRRQMLRVYRTEAMIALMELQTAEEKYFLRNNAYSNNISAAAPSGLGLATSSRSNKYFLSIAVASDGHSFIATATPTPDGGQSMDLECLAFSVDARGHRAVSGTKDVSYCWK
jgi:type IV pilus assembly protein PilE